MRILGGRHRYLGPALLALAAGALPAQAQAGPTEVGLPTDEGVARYLARGRELALAKEWAKAADVFQRVIDGHPDISPGVPSRVLAGSLLPDASDPALFRTARELAVRELAALPPEGVAAYRVLGDPPARAALEAALRVEDLPSRIAALRRVAGSYLVSSVGDDALARAADLCLDLGREQEALDLYRQVLELCPPDPERDVALLLAKAAYCAARIGDEARRDALLARLAESFPEARVLVAGTPVASAALREHPILKRGAGAALPAPSDRPLPGGDATRSLESDDLPESLPARPFWSFGLHEREPRFELDVDGRNFAATNHDREPSVEPAGVADGGVARPFPALRPVVASDAVLYCDGVEFVVRSAGSGALLGFRRAPRRPEQPGEALDHRPSVDRAWRFPLRLVRPWTTALELEEEESPGIWFPRPPERAAAPAQNLAQLFEDVYRWYDYGGASVVVEGERVVVCPRSAESPPAHLLNERFHDRRPAYREEPYGPQVYDLATGRLLWSWSLGPVGDEEAQARARADRAEHPKPLFFGPGVPRDGALYALVSETTPSPGVFLWCFDMERGEVLFRTLLHHLDEAPRRLPADSTIAVAGGLVYALTNSGVVAAVEAHAPGRLRWVRRYERATRGASVVQRLALADPVVTRGRLIVAPADGTRILALDAETGALAWSRDNRGLRGVVGVGNGILVVAGKSTVQGISIADGKDAWAARPLSGDAHGRGFVGRTRVYVPVAVPRASAAIRCFDLATGAPAGSIELEVERLGNLVHAGGRLVVANEAAVHCFTTLEAELARLDARAAREGTSAALHEERARLHLRGGAGDAREAARREWRLAIEAAEARGEDSRRLRVRAVENLIALARGAGGASALEEAASLAREPALRALVEAARVEVLAARGEAAAAIAAIEGFPAELEGTAVPAGDRVLPAREALAAVLAEARRALPEFEAAYAARVRERVAAAAEARDLAALEAIPERYGRVPPSEEAWIALAELHAGAGRHEDAQLLLRSAAARANVADQRGRLLLHLALHLARRGHLESGRRERASALRLYAAAGAPPPETLLSEIASLVDATGQGPPLPRVRLPLRRHAFAIADAVPVPIAGEVPAPLQGLALVAREGRVAAVRADGTPLWATEPFSEEYARAGPPAEPLTLATAGVIADGRFCRAVGDDLLVGDLYGVARVRAADGAPIWRHPAQRVPEALAALRSEMRVRHRGETRARRLLVPGFALHGDLLVRVLPTGEVECFSAGTGGVVWRDDTVKGSPSGPPQIADGLLVVGWTKPARARVYTVLGQLLREETAAEGVLLAPPLLDPRGRLVLLEASDERASAARLRAVDARSGSPVPGGGLELHSTSAAVLHANETFAVVHDGSSRGAGDPDGGNVHFLDWETGARASVRGEDLFGVVHLLPDADRVFVFTHELAPGQERARLFRVDLASRAVFAYEHPPAAAAYARPILTQHHVVVACAGPAAANLRLYDRDAAEAPAGPEPVFDAKPGSAEERELVLRKRGDPRFDAPPALAVVGEGLLVGNPHGAVLVAATPR